MNTLLYRALAPILIASVVAGACTDRGRADPPLDGVPSVTVTGTEMAFAPSEVHLPATGANLIFRNGGRSEHDLTIPDLGIHLSARAGTSVTTGLRAPRPGRYQAFCSMRGHAEAGMRLIVIVDQ